MFFLQVVVLFIHLRVGPSYREVKQPCRLSLEWSGTRRHFAWWGSKWKKKSEALSLKHDMITHSSDNADLVRSRFSVSEENVRQLTNNRCLVHQVTVTVSSLTELEC